MSTALEGRTVVVPGGTGNVGEGVVRSLLTAGARVVVPSRTQARLDNLTALIGPALSARLLAIRARYGTFAEAETFANAVIQQVGEVNDVVSLIGGWWQGKRLWDVSEEDWQTVFIAPATTHLALVKAFVPRLADGSTYTIIAGFSSLHAYPMAGLVSMQGAAQLMMVDVLRAELDGHLRLNDIMLGPVINRSRPRGHKSWLTADQVGDVVVRVLEDPGVAATRIDVQDIDRMKGFLNA